MNDLHHLDATNQNIIDWCDRWRQLSVEDVSVRDRILGSCNSNTLLRMNEHAIVKFGTPVTASEAANQQYAWRRLESNSFHSVRVPRVYRFFQDSTCPEDYWQDPVGYLVMEFVPGTALSDLPAAELPAVVKNVAALVHSLSLIKSENNRPGPLDGGEPQGPIWAPDDLTYEKFESIGGLEAWFNRALIKENATINLHQYPLSFCHLDLARRNMLRVDDQTIYLLDWATAGFYPSIFETWNLAITNSNDPSYMKALVHQLPSLSTEEQETCWLLWCAYRRNMLHGWYALSPLKTPI